MKTFALGLLAALLLAAPASATHSWNNYHWARQSNATALKVGDNVTSAWDTYLANATAQWDRSALTLVPAAGSSNKRCGAVSGTVQVCNSKYGQNQWLGLAQIWLSGGHIVQGTAKMNDTYFEMAKYNNPDERAHVMCQEVGHDFGLGHTSEDGSVQDTCMDYSTSPTSTAPNQHDYDMLASIYGHSDPTTSIASSSSSSAKGPSLAEREDSRPYRTDRHDSKRFTVIEERFSDGSMRVAHYVWAG